MHEGDSNRLVVSWTAGNELLREAQLQFTEVIDPILLA